MLLLLGLLLLVGVVLYGLFWGGSAIAQGTLYTEPTTGLPWRAAAAAGAITALLAVWCLLNWGATDRKNLPFTTLLEFKASGTVQVPEFWAIRIDEQGNPVGEPELYTLGREDNGRPAYFHRPAGTGERRKWVRADSRGLVAAVEVAEKPDGPRTRFSAPLETVKETRTGPDGAPAVVERKVLKVPKVRSGMGQETALDLRYTAPDGRYMTDTAIGQVTSDRLLLALANLVLNALHFAVWFAVLWPLLRFQWAHALGLAVVMWLLTTFAVLPVLFERVPLSTSTAPPGAAVPPTKPA